VSERGAVTRPPLTRDLAATAALAAYSLAVGIGFGRVFSGWDFARDMVLLVLVGHGSSFAMRRAGVSGWISIPAMTLLSLWTLSLYQYSSTMSLLVPGRATWDRFSLDIDVVREQFQTAVAPVIYEVGWATLAGLALIIVIVMADAFAFKAEARAEALVPGGVLFVFIAALSRDRMRLTSTALLIATGIVAVVALRRLHDRTRHVELSSSRSRTSLALPSAVGVAVVVAVLAGLIGPRIPGADAEPLYRTRGRGGGITSVTNPLVDIRSRLVNHGNFELFRMNADAESYWRVLTLPEFDGRTFSLPSRDLSRADQVQQPQDGEQTIRQQLQILALEGKLIPAAADPVQISRHEEVRQNFDSAALVKTEDLVPGDGFTIVSVSPDVSLDELRAATTSDPPDEMFVELPDDVPGVVERLATEVTAGAATDADKMLALQNWFQGFEYSTEVQAGHGNNAIETFLQIRKGYCEQFAGTFAVMARSLGIPSRVAVGYTSGRLRSDGWYSVLGKNSHAWPEIWFDGLGWVPFEPTPSRGIPGAEDYTGIAPQQDLSPVDPDQTDPEAAPLPAPPTTVFSPPTTVRPRPDIQDPDARPQAPAPQGGSSSTPPRDEGSIPWGWLLGAVIVAGGVAAPAVARRWARRSARHHGTQQRVVASWQRACRAVARAGVSGTPSMTAREWAAATAHELPVAARPMTSLASLVDRVTYARPDTLEAADTYGHDSELWSAQVGRIADDTLSGRERIERYFREWR
jgi:hypothetical protein